MTDNEKNIISRWGEGNAILLSNGRRVATKEGKGLDNGKIVVT